MDPIVKKKIIAGIVIAVLIAAGIVAAVIMKSPSKEASESEIQASAGQKIVYATIDAIAGNDIEVSLLDEDMVKQFSSVGRAEEENEETAERGGFGGGNMPDMSGGEFPGGAGGFGGEMPDMEGMPNMEGMPEGGMQMPPFGQEAEEKKASYQIPVGTDVVTTLGATTTFSHLEEGDTIAILMEENSEAILKIWMIM